MPTMTITREEAVAQLIEELTELFPVNTDAAWRRFDIVKQQLDEEMANHVLDMLVTDGVLLCIDDDCTAHFTDHPHTCDCTFLVFHAA